jgi:Cytochrome P460
MTQVPGTVYDLDFMVKDATRFADSGGWRYGVIKHDAASGT